MAKFEWAEFMDNYGFMVNAKKYTKEEAIAIARREWELDTAAVLEVCEEYIRYTVNYGFYFEDEVVGGGYITCSGNERGAFPVWRVTIKNYGGDHDDH